MADPAPKRVPRGYGLHTIPGRCLPETPPKSFDEPDNEALEGAWEAEIERRLAEYDRGRVAAIDAEEVFAKARRLAR